MEIYVIRDREAGNIIQMFASLEEAEKELACYELYDKQEGIYVPKFL